MKKTDDLYELIHSMTSAEKRFFSLTVKRYEGDKKYLKVFKVFENEKNYDEKKIEQKLNKLRLSNNISKTKNYLYNLLIESLSAKHESTYSTFYKEMIKVDLLHSKGLYKQAYDIVDNKKNKPKLIKEERLEPLITLLNWETKFIAYRIKSTGKYFDVEKLFEELNTYLHKALNVSFFKEKYYKVNRYVWEKGGIVNIEDKKKITELFSSDFFSTINNATTIASKCAFYESMALKYLLTGIYNKKEVEFNLNHYLLTINNLKSYNNYEEYGIALLMCSQYANFLNIGTVERNCIEKINAILLKIGQKKEYNAWETNFILKGFRFNLDYYTKHKQYFEAEKLIQTNDYFKIINFNLAEPRALLNVYYALVYYYFLKREFNLVFSYLNKILNQPFNTDSFNVLMFKLLRLIACIELEEESVFKSSFLSLQKNLTASKGELYVDLLILIQLLKSTLFIGLLKKEKRERWKKVHEKLKDIYNNHSPIFSETRFPEIIKWAEEKIANT